MTKGILVGSDSKSEWLLKWWWDNYSAHNRLPVCFVDFGMSLDAIKFCQQRGSLVTLKQQVKLTPKEEINQKTVQKWNESPTPFWHIREAFFKKPFALKISPFDQTLWMDLDCEVMGSIETAFYYLTKEFCLMKLRDKGSKTLYNAGVMLFKNKASLIDLWCELVERENANFLSDQDALTETIFREKVSVDHLPSIYNWQMCRGLNLEAKILHWSADWGKEYIKAHGGLKPLIFSSLKSHAFSFFPQGLKNPPHDEKSDLASHP